MTNAKAKKVNTSAEVAKAVSSPVEIAVLFKETELYTGEKAIFKALESAYVQAQDINKEYQKIALSCIKHSMLHGDITVISRLIDRFPEGLRKDSLSAYFDKFGCVNFIPQNQLDSKNPLFDAKSTKVVAVYSKEKREKMKKDGWYLQAATNWWYRAAKQTEYKPVVDIEQLQRLIGMLVNKAKHPKEGDKINPALVDELVLLSNKYKANAEQVALAA